MLDNQNIEHSGSLSKSYKELEKLKEINEILVSEKRPEALISYLKTAERQLAEKDGDTFA
jgi:hypothetical protein